MNMVALFAMKKKQWEIGGKFLVWSSCFFSKCQWLSAQSKPTSPHWHSDFSLQKGRPCSFRSWQFSVVLVWLMSYFKVDARVRHHSSKSKRQYACCASCGSWQPGGRPSRKVDLSFVGLSAVDLLKYAQKGIAVDVNAKFCTDCAPDLNAEKMKAMYVCIETKSDCVILTNDYL